MSMHIPGITDPMTDQPNPEDQLASFVRVEVGTQKREELKGAMEVLLSAYPYLGSLAVGDNVAYSAVSTPHMRWAGTDGVSILLNNTPNGFFTNPGDTALPEDLDATAAARAGVTPGRTTGAITHGPSATGPASVSAHGPAQGPIKGPANPYSRSPIKPPTPDQLAAPLNRDEQVFVLARNILHIAREDSLWRHVFSVQGYVPVPRSATAPDGKLPFDQRIFQDAVDAQVNSALVQDRVGSPPPGAFIHNDVSWDMPFGEAYAALWEDAPPPPPGQGGKGGEDGQGQPPPSGPSPHNQTGGSVLAPGQGGKPDSATDDPTDPDTLPQDPQAAADRIAETAHEREQAHRRAAEFARQAGMGSSAVERMVTKAREPQVDWRSYIHGFLSKSGGSDAWNWKRPNKGPLMRGFLGHEPYYAPDRGSHGVNHIVLVADTSGSIRESEHRHFIAIVCEMLSSLRPKRVTWIFCDSAVQRVDDLDPEDTDFREYNIPRGGGTDFHPPFEWVRENLSADEMPDALIYLTDLEGAAPQEAPGYPVLWCCTLKHTKPVCGGGEWGEVVHVPVADLNPDS